MDPNIPWKLDNDIYDQELTKRLQCIDDLAVQEEIRVGTEYVQSRFTDSAVIDDIYLLLDCIHQVFKAHDIKYWACFGTLLGCQRHGGVIPWDDDADICTFVESRPKIQGLVDVFLANGIVLCPRLSLKTQTYTDKFYKFALIDKDDPFKNPFPFVDMFFCETREDGSVIPMADWGRQAHISLDEVEPIQEVKFGNIKLNIPKCPSSILSREFGKDYMEKGVMPCNDHETSWIVKKRPAVFDMNPFVGVPATSNYVSQDFVVDI